MVQARKRFLDAGHYQPIAAQVNRLLLEQLGDLPEPRILDLGCGEGYYTAQLEAALNAAGQAPQLAGVDISKHAIKSACKRSSSIQWLVATGADLPLAEGALDALTLMFSRVMPDPMARVLKPGGLLLVVWPGPEHLLELRQLIYTEVKRHQYDPTSALETLFETVQQESLRFAVELDCAAGIADLLAMTPHGQRIGSQAREQLLDKGCLDCHADIRFALFRRRCTP